LRRASTFLALLVKIAVSSGAGPQRPIDSVAFGDFLEWTAKVFCWWYEVAVLRREWSAVESKATVPPKFVPTAAFDPF
jgi:hypothetical protein